jgi:hypothetical protein
MYKFSMGSNSGRTVIVDGSKSLIFTTPSIAQVLALKEVNVI